MGKKSFAALLLVFMFGLQIVCFGQTYWKRTLRSLYINNFDYPMLIQTQDGNLLFEVSGFAIKMKPNGDTIWTKSFVFPGSSYSSLNGMRQTKDGNLLLFLSNNSDRSYGVMKIDQNGDTLWTNYLWTRKSENEGKVNGMTTTDDDTMYVVTTNVPFSSPEDLVIKLSPQGDILWKKPCNAVCNLDFTSLMNPSADSAIIIAGLHRNEFDGLRVSKINLQGATVWSKFFTLSPDRTGESKYLVQDKKGNIYMSVMDESDWPSYTFDVLKLAPNGDSLWIKMFHSPTFYDGKPEPMQPGGFIQCEEGKFLAAGWTIRNMIMNGTQVTGYHGGAMWMMKVDENGNAIWNRYMNWTTADRPLAMLKTQAGMYLAGISYKNDLTVSTPTLWLMSLLPDQYAKKDSLFSFKIPVSGDSLNHGYAPLKVPAGMTVSQGGTISWTPKTDSSYLDHVEYMVSDDFGKKDTLTFNLFVNNPGVLNNAVTPPMSSRAFSEKFRISVTSLPSCVTFSLPFKTATLEIYDIKGTLKTRVPVANNTAFWRGTTPAGRYVARIMDGKRCLAKPFVLVK
jgi:hypothetical protein